jgi:metal-responsive CopG/Arc/MetJ family transcriptional regulator
METVKTAISIQKPLFEQAELLARRMRVSRSRLFALALEDYIRRQESRELLARINAAYADELDADEARMLDEFLIQHRQVVEGEW